MHYASVEHLPRTLQETLPVEAQAVYLNTYNRIWEQYAQTTRDAATLATLSHQMAWDTMTRQFTLIKSDEQSQWVRKGEESTAETQQAPAEKRGFFARLGFR
jgi:cation transport regulator ChaB